MSDKDQDLSLGKRTPWRLQGAICLLFIALPGQSTADPMPTPAAVGHASITAVAASPDLHYITCGRSDGAVFVWSDNGGQPMSLIWSEYLDGHADDQMKVESMVVDTTGYLDIATGSSAFRFSLRDGSRQGTPLRFDDSLNLLEAQVLGDGSIAAILRNGAVDMRSFEDLTGWSQQFKVIGSLVSGSVCVGSVVMAVDTGNGEVDILRSGSSEPIGKASAYLAANPGCHFSADGTRFVCMANSQTDLIIWFGASKGFTHAIHSEDADPLVAMSPDGHSVAVSSVPWMISVWRISDGESIVADAYTYHGPGIHVTPVRTATYLGFAPTGDAILEGDVLGQVLIWKFATDHGALTLSTSDVGMTEVPPHK